MKSIRWLVLKVAALTVAAMGTGCASQRLGTALAQGRTDLVKQYLDQGEKAQESVNGMPSLSYALNSETMKVLIAHGADPNATALTGNTPLVSLAVSGEESDVILKRFREGNAAAIKNMGSEEAARPYLSATDPKDVEDLYSRTKTLIELGADPNKPCGANPVYAIVAAAKSHRAGVVRALVESKKADLEVRWNELFTGAAATANSISIGLHVDSYLNASAAERSKLWDRISKFNNALFDAVEEKDLEMVKLLVEGGANVNAMVKRGEGTSARPWIVRTPLDFAVAGGSADIVAYLQGKGAKRGTPE